MTTHARCGNRRLLAPVFCYLLMFLLAGCLTHKAPKPKPKAPERSHAPAWLMKTPKGCAVGHSGPTINPGDSLRYATEQARQFLAADKLAVRLESHLVVGAREVVEADVQEVEGWLGETRVISAYVDGNPDDPHFLERQAYALACWAEAEVARQHGGGQAVPGWVYDPRAGAASQCVLGISGPTMEAKDQEPRALDDGVQTLARMRGVKVFSFIADDGAKAITWMHAEEVSEEAVDAERALAKVEARWKDEKGVGPLRLRGVLYAQVCAPR